MNEYEVQHRIHTLAEIYEPFDYRGFTFSLWDYDSITGTCGEAWLAEKVVSAETANDAFRQFLSKLNEAVSRVSFVSQCYTTALHETFILRKINNNSSNIFYFHFSERIEYVSLSFLNDEISALHALESYEERGDVFQYLQEAATAPSFYTRLSMLISALEAIAGEAPSDSDRNKRTNKEYIRDEILKNDDLYDQIFKYGDGIRGQLFHGGKINLETEDRKGIDFVGSVYAAILMYFRDKHGVELNLDVVDPMRNPLGNFEVWRSWVEPRREDTDLSLLSVHRLFKGDREGKAAASVLDFGRSFKLLNAMPSGY